MEKIDWNATAEIVRGMIKHENELVNHRITWLCQLQGLLFATLGFSWDEKDTHIFIYCLCLIGIFVAMSSLVSLASADYAINDILLWWDTHKPIEYVGTDVIGLTNTGIGKRKAFVAKIFFCKIQIKKNMYPWHFLPRLFVVAWGVILLFSFTR